MTRAFAFSRPFNFSTSFLNILAFKPVDRIPLMDFGYWEETIKRWHSEGLPHNGNTTKLCSKFVELRVEGHFPLEVNAGSTPETMRERYPNMAFIGGIRKTPLAKGKKAIDEELANCHRYQRRMAIRVPPDVSMENYKYYVQRKKEILDKFGGH